MRWLFFCWMVGMPAVSVAQTLLIRSSETGRPLPAAHLVLRQHDRQLLLVSDAQGRCTWPNWSLESPVFIEISSVGFVKLRDTLRTTFPQELRLKPLVAGLETVVVTAQFNPGSAEQSVMPIRVIDANKMQRMGAQNLRDVLTNELNIRLGQDQVLGSSMSIQGISGQNVKILVDGVPVNGRLNGNIDLSQINIHNIERIELMEGPLSVIYGTDALGGTINLITKRPDSSAVQLQLNTHYESIGQYNAQASVAVNRGKHQVQLQGGRNYFDGWSAGDPAFAWQRTRPAELRAQAWNPKEQFFGTGSYQFKQQNWEVRYTFDAFDELISNLGRPRAPFGLTAFDDYYRTQRYNHAMHAKGLWKRYQWQFLVARNDFRRTKNTYFKDLTNLEEQLSSNAGDQDTSRFLNWNSRATVSSAYSKKLQLELGYDLNHEQSFGQRMRNATENIGDYALFGSAEWRPVPTLTVRPGLRVAHNTAFAAPVIPSLNLRYQSQFGEKQQALLTQRFAYARGFRAPSLKELHFFFVDINHNIQGNPDLEAERGHHFQYALSVKRQHRKQLYQYEIGTFFNHINNQITLAQRSAEAFSYFNLDRFRSTGVQLQADIINERWRASAGFSMIGRYNQLAEKRDDLNSLYWSPEARAQLQYHWLEKDLSFSLFHKFNGALPTFFEQADGTVQQQITAAYQLLDLSMAKNFLNKQWMLNVGVKNLLNVTDVAGQLQGGVHSSGGGTVPMAMGRVAFVSLQYHFKS